MINNHYRICKKKISTASELTRHANTMHQGRTTLSRKTELNSQQSRRTYSVPRPEHDKNLWNSPVTITPVTNTNFPFTLVNDPQVDDVNIEIEIEESRYNLRSRMQN